MAINDSFLRSMLGVIYNLDIMKWDPPAKIAMTALIGVLLIIATLIVRPMIVNIPMSDVSVDATQIIIIALINLVMFYMGQQSQK